MVTPTDVNKFQQAYSRRFGIELEGFEARAKLELLVRHMEIIYQPITTEQLKAVNVNENSYEQGKPEPKANKRLI